MGSIAAFGDTDDGITETADQHAGQPFHERGKIDDTEIQLMTEPDERIHRQSGMWLRCAKETYRAYQPRLLKSNHIYAIIVPMVNRMRATRSHRNNRRSHHALDAARTSKCSNCAAAHRSHAICMNCGWYNGRKVLDLAARAEKKAAKAKAAAK